MNGKKKLAVSLLIMTLVLSASFLSGCGKEEKPKKVVVNSLTGELGKESKVLDKRIVGIVIENHPQARPQWGMDDEKYAPDMILQAEVEGGITRMLWMYADYSKLPETVGPVRSARPPFVRFSELFDSIFIHWGMSESSDTYKGADHYFDKDDVDHIDAMIYMRENEVFGRAQGSGRSLEHTGILHGNALAEELESKDFRTDLDKKATTKLAFNKSLKKVGKEGCTSVTLKFSEQAKEAITWTYSKEDHLYYTSHFNNKAARTNLLILFDETEYAGKYCNYAMDGGKGKLISKGTVVDIEWKVTKKGKLSLTRKGKDDKDVKVKLNPGKTWIGWTSSNHGGMATVVDDSDNAKESKTSKDKK